MEKAKKADYVIFVGGLNKSAEQDCEDSDRKGLELPYGQDRVIEALAAANPNLAVVNISGNAVAMPWADKVPAIVQTWYLGSETGNALADVLSGDVNPSGKLPFTFPVRLSDAPAHRSAKSYPGIRREGSDIWDVTYEEGIFVGYRWAEKHRVKPLFAFGHGLSYTTFEYSEPIADKKQIAAGDSLTVSLRVTNSGPVAGQEVVQLYISDKKSSLPRPVKELKGFRKVSLLPGETKEVSFTVGRDALSFYDDTADCWVAEPGRFEAIIGASSADIRGKVAFELK